MCPFQAESGDEDPLPFGSARGAVRLTPRLRSNSVPQVGHSQEADGKHAEGEEAKTFPTIAICPRTTRWGFFNHF